MFILSGVGFVLYRTGKISNEGSKNIGNILIFLALPCVIINGFLGERSQERLVGLLVSALLALLVLFLSMLVSRILCGRHALDNFAGSFSNPGFFGVPIIVASLTDGAVFYPSSLAYFSFLHSFQCHLFLANASNTLQMSIHRSPCLQLESMRHRQNLAQCF